MNVTPQLLNSLTQTIVERFAPERVIFFGSRAYGVPNEYSDLDLLVVMSCEGSQFRKGLEILKSIRGVSPWTLDIKVYSPDEMGWRYDGLDPVVHDALDKGQILYERRQHHLAMVGGC